jgi:hypothetical protein
METQYILTESELLEILGDRCTLAALEAAGVDNWEGYNTAYEEYFEEGHLYLYKGVIIPSVSDILKFIFPNKYSDIPIEILKNKAIYGTKVHEVVEILEREQIFDIVALKQEIEGINYIIESSIEQYLKLKKENEIEMIEQEQMVHYKNLYAGRFDMVAKIKNEKSLCDIKTTAELDEEYLSWQLSFYELAKGQKYEKFYAIWLPKKGLGKIVEIKRKTKKELLDKLKEYLDCRNNE